MTIPTITLPSVEQIAAPPARRQAGRLDFLGDDKFTKALYKQLMQQQLGGLISPPQGVTLNGGIINYPPIPPAKPSEQLPPPATEPE